MVNAYIAWLSAFPIVLVWGAYEGPKIVWSWAGGFALSLFWIIRLIRSSFIPYRSEDQWYLIWIGILTFASIMGIHPVDSIIGGSYRHQGVLFFFTMYLIGLTIRLLRQKHLRFLYTVMSALLVVQSLILILQKAGSLSLRVSGTLGEPNAAAGYLVFGLYWILTLENIPVVYRNISTALILTAVTATESRIGLLLAISAYLFHLRLRPGWKRVRAILFGTLLGTLVFVSTNRYVEKRIYDIVHGVTNYESRTVYLQSGFTELLTRPVFGFGAESGEAVYNRAFAKQHVRLVDFMVDRSHNIFLDIALWSGFVGLTAFCLWLTILLNRLVVLREYDEVYMIILWLIFACFQPIGVIHWIQFVILIFPVNRLHALPDVG